MWEFKLEVLQWKENCILQKSAGGSLSFCVNHGDERAAYCKISDKNDDIMSASTSLIG